ncbi:MAG: transporter permease [Solirubrobacterales bacterium]|nr:transporter permease [Solirubrobacterales bacterium]
MATTTNPQTPEGGFGPALRGRLAAPLEILAFMGRAIFETRGAWRYSAEIMRQTALLITGSVLVLVVLQMVMGGICGIFGNYALRSLGASDATGYFTALCDRSTPLVMCGYVLSAKVGCGLVAEIGSMKISDELDAFRSVGLDPMRFVVATRLVAVWLVLPLFYCVSQFAAEAGSYISVVHVIGEVSQGTWEGTHWPLRSTTDLWLNLIQFFTIGSTVVLVAMYYGYTVPPGGPPAVGAATARSMILNLVLVHVIYGAFSLAFYGGGNVMLPVGG